MTFATKYQLALLGQNSKQQSALHLKRLNEEAWNKYIPLNEFKRQGVVFDTSGSVNFRVYNNDDY